MYGIMVGVGPGDSATWGRIADSRDPRADATDEFAALEHEMAVENRDEDLAGADGLMSEAFGEQLRTPEGRAALAAAFHAGDWAGLGMLFGESAVRYWEQRNRELAAAKMRGDNLRAADDAQAAAILAAKVGGGEYFAGASIGTTTVR